MTKPQFVKVVWLGDKGPTESHIETQWLNTEARREGAPVLVFLHEGLGSLSAWRDFPLQLCRAAGLCGLEFSRHGYGQSTQRTAAEAWGPNYLHAQALEFLPAYFEAVGLNAQTTPPWLFGHSDGGSIALLHAARFPSRVAGVIAVASHVFVEPVTLQQLQLARAAYEAPPQPGDLRSRLARHHRDPDSPFYGWNDAWLNPAFQAWNIEADLQGLCCPLLVVQGEDDEYATLAQVDAIQARLPQAQRCVLPGCGHSPHREQPQALIEHSLAFLKQQGIATPQGL